MNGPRNCCIPCRTNLLGSARRATQMDIRAVRRNSISPSLCSAAVSASSASPELERESGRESASSIIPLDMSTRHSPTAFRTRYMSSDANFCNAGTIWSEASPTVDPARRRGRAWTAARRTRKCASVLSNSSGGTIWVETMAGVTAAAAELSFALDAAFALDDDDEEQGGEGRECDAISARRLAATILSSTGPGGGSPPFPPLLAAAALAAAALAFFFFRFGLNLLEPLPSSSSSSVAAANFAASAIITSTSAVRSRPGRHKFDKLSEAHLRVSGSPSRSNRNRYGTTVSVTAR
mmetsp:Transcript_27349/g.64072  ORF Transcript_27349/g.64072 Transcript_27349/m.64072 type:complete len:294 (+) Transcript_27349:66-947(+)